MVTFWQNLRMFLGLTVLTGIAYPLLMTGISQLTMNRQANGSFLEKDGQIVGSKFIGQNFKSKKYFWPRPSASDYNALQSGGSNQGPTSALLKKAVADRKERLKTGKEQKIPSDLLYASGSGLDPHISLNAAQFQIERVMKSRGWGSEEQRMKVEKLLKEETLYPIFSLGEPFVNVLEINLKLDTL